MDNRHMKINISGYLGDNIMSNYNLEKLDECTTSIIIPQVKYDLIGLTYQYPIFFIFY